MEKFNKTLRGYDPKQVNAFLDITIKQVEKMVAEIKDQESKIAEYHREVSELRQQVERYKNMEITMNKTIVAAQDSGEQIRRMARQESEAIVSEARRNANRIVNDSLLRAERVEYEASRLRRNTSLLKKKLRSILESQLEMVDEIEVLDMESIG